MKINSVLVTGGAGFIGSNFVQHCLDNDPDMKIYIIDSLTYAANILNVPKSDRVELYYGSIVHSTFLLKELIEKVDAVVHFAAESAVSRSVLDNKIFVETDVIGTMTLAEIALKSKIKKFIHISSSEVYGTAKGDCSMNEKQLLEPCSPYAGAKCAADRLIFSYWYTYKFPAIIVRPFNNYGPGQHLEKVVPKFIVQSLLESPMTISGDGEAERDWLYVEDNCEAIFKILTQSEEFDHGEVFNVGTGVASCVNDIATYIEALFREKGIYVKKEYVDSRPGQVKRHIADFSKIQQRYGWSPRTSLDAGLRKTINWYKNNENIWHHQLHLMHTYIFENGGKRVCY